MTNGLLFRQSLVRDVIGQGLHALDMPRAAAGLALPLPAADAAAPGAALPPGNAERAYAVTRGVAAIGLKGILTPNSEILARWFGWTTYHGFAALAADLAAAEDVSAVAVESDSPGGMVLGIESAAEALAALAAVKPVHVLVNPMAASAAYWIASQASEVVLTPGAIVGSIGVGLVTASYPVPSQLFGEQVHEITSTHARAKWPDPSTEGGMAEIKRDLDVIEARFHAAVAAGRGIAPDQLAGRLSVTADPRDGGAVFAGQDAIDRGLADRQETRDAFYQRLFGTYAPPAGKSARAEAQIAAARARARAAAAQAG
jgi:ClpP class serine protease